MNRCSKQMQRGFTLVELLVTVGILAVLVSILIPAAHKMIRAGKATQCASNLRITYTGFQTYAADHDGAIVIARVKLDGNLQGWPYFYTNGNSIMDVKGGPKHIPYKAWLCPESFEYAEYSSDKLPDNNDDGYVGPNKEEAGRRGYGIFWPTNNSDALLKRMQNLQIIESTGPYTFRGVWYQNFKNVATDPSSIIFLADSAFKAKTGPYLDPTVVAMVPVFTFNDRNEGGYYGGRIFTLHGTKQGVANVAFYDGHVEALDARGMRKTATKLRYSYSRDLKDIDMQ